MKGHEAVKALDAVFTELTAQLIKMRFEATFVTSLFKDTIIQLEESLQAAKDFKRSKNLDASVMGLWVALPIVDLTATKADWFSVGSTKVEEDEILSTLIHNLNKQHQWLLVEAFESLETYLKDLYGVLGYLDRSLWRCSDFGNITPTEISGNDLEWHKKLVHKTFSQNTKNIRNIMTDKITGLSDYLSNNCRRRDYDFLIGCIETLRHVIVHSSGKICWNCLLKGVSKNTGKTLSGDKKGPKSLRQYLHELTESSVNGSMVEITLINKANLHPPFHFVNQPFLQILEHLGSYGALLYTQSLRHFNEQPNWIRAVSAKP